MGDGFVGMVQGLKTILPIYIIRLWTRIIYNILQLVMCRLGLGPKPRLGLSLEGPTAWVMVRPSQSCQGGLSLGFLEKVSKFCVLSWLTFTRRLSNVKSELSGVQTKVMTHNKWNGCNYQYILVWAMGRLLNHALGCSELFSESATWKCINSHLINTYLNPLEVYWVNSASPMTIPCAES